jgi:hypothetical protein
MAEPALADFFVRERVASSDFFPSLFDRTLLIFANRFVIDRCLVESVNRRVGLRSRAGARIGNHIESVRQVTVSGKAIVAQA